MAGVVALGGLIYVSTLWAQPAASTTSVRPTTKVALLNITYVMKHYYKTKTYTDELKNALEPFSKKDTKLKADGTALAKERGEAKTTAERRDVIDGALKKLERELDDNKQEAQKLLIKKQEEQLKILYNDVRDCVHRYAMAHGYEMVLHYHEPLAPEEFPSAANVLRKLNVGALVPMYHANGLDISLNIVTTLNQGQAARRQ